MTWDIFKTHNLITKQLRVLKLAKKKLKLESGIFFLVNYRKGRYQPISFYFNYVKEIVNLFSYNKKFISA